MGCKRYDKTFSTVFQVVVRVLSGPAGPARDPPRARAGLVPRLACARHDERTCVRVCERVWDEWERAGGMEPLSWPCKVATAGEVGTAGEHDAGPEAATAGIKPAHRESRPPGKPASALSACRANACGRSRRRRGSNPATGKSAGTRGGKERRRRESNPRDREKQGGPRLPAKTASRLQRARRVAANEDTPGNGAPRQEGPRSREAAERRRHQEPIPLGPRTRRDRRAWRTRRQETTSLTRKGTRVAAK